ncbi:hypothetical protein J6A31_03555 [bacterium]|nr:hypothetical protein [bacterium]
MGMAASQARFLGLTARRNNVEFEGQQINQQRTSLSNQSANYYNDLLGMSVPVPPSVDDFTKTVYTYEDGVMTNEITTMIAQKEGTYTISYLSRWQDDYVPVAASTNIINVQEVNNTVVYNVGSQTLRGLGELDTTLTDPAAQTARQEEEKAWAKQLEEKYGVAQDGWMIRYIKDSSTGEDVPYFYRKAEIEKAAKQHDDNGNILSNIGCYTIGSDTKTREVKAVDNVLVERDSSGRFVSISIPNTKADPNDPTTYSTYSLTTNTMTDQDAYNDAMNKYEHEKYLYDQAIQDINAKIEVVQAQDKNLELRLKQLDTEHNAIQTEMDAVSKVIQKNTESSFKTFG